VFKIDCISCNVHCWRRRRHFYNRDKSWGWRKTQKGAWVAAQQETTDERGRGGCLVYYGLPSRC